MPVAVQGFGVPPRGAHPSHDQPQPLWPTSTGVEAAQLGDLVLGVRARVLVQSSRPGALGQGRDRFLVGGGDGPSDGVAHGTPGGVQPFQVVEEVVGDAGPVDANQGLCS